MKPNPNQLADFTEADTSLLQQDFLVNLPATNSEICNNETVSQVGKSECLITAFHVFYSVPVKNHRKVGKG